MATNITAQNTWTTAFEVPVSPGSTYSMMLGIRGTWENGTAVTVQWWRKDETSASANEYATVLAADGGSHIVTVAGPIVVRAGVKTGGFGSGDNIYVDLG